MRLLAEMATRNTAWGYTRLRGALRNVGYEVGRNTIKRILRERGIELAPQRRRRYSWAAFIKAHLSGMAAADFFTVEVRKLAHTKIVDDEQRDGGQVGEELLAGAVDAGVGDLLDEDVSFAVDDAMALRIGIMGRWRPGTEPRSRV